MSREALAARTLSGRLLSKYAFDTQKVEALLSNILNQCLPNILYGVSLIVLADGRLSEEGDFGTLLARDGAYARRIAAQNAGDDFIQP